MPATSDERVISGLPRSLFWTRRGEPRMRRLQASRLSASEVRRVLEIRDRLLHLYAPPRYSEPKGRVWVGINSEYTYETGSRHWHRRTSGGRTMRWPEDIPYLVVEDPDDPDWMPSLQAWCDHLSGFASLLPRWEREDDLTSVLIDIDHPWTRLWLPEESDIVGMVRQIVAAIESIETLSGVALPVELLWTGNTGIWIHLHMIRPVDHRVAAEFALLVGSMMRMDPDRSWHNQYPIFAVGVDPQVIARSGDPDGWKPLFRPKPRAGSRTRFRYSATIDGGNIVTRPCRMPFAAHQRSLRPAMFVDRDGRVIDDQVAHLMSMERREVDLEEIVEDLVAGAGRGPAPEVPVAGGGDTAAPPTTDPGRVMDLCPPASRSRERETTGVVTNVTSGLPRHPVPGTSGQWVVLLDDVLGADWIGGVTGDEDLSEILVTFGDGPEDGTYRALIVQGGLIRVYAWLSRRGCEITEDAVVALVMSRYIGAESGRADEIRRMVRSDIRSGIPDLTPWSRRRSLALRVPEVLATAGITNETTTRVLQAISCKANGDDIANTTHRELARIIGLVPVDCTDRGQLAVAAIRIGRCIRRLIDGGLLTRLSDGDMRDGTPSVYRIEIDDGR